MPTAVIAMERVLPRTSACACKFGVYPSRSATASISRRVFGETRWNCLEFSTSDTVASLFPVSSATCFSVMQLMLTFNLNFCNYAFISLVNRLTSL